MIRVLIKSLLTVAFVSACNRSPEISGVLNVPGAVFEYTAEGNGVPCVVFTGSENIGHQLYSDELRKHVTFIHADPSNISAEQLEALTMETVVDDIERLRLALGVEKIAVMGHSMFAPVPLEYALKYPQHTLWSLLSGGLPNTTTETLQTAQEYWETTASDERKAIREANHRALAEADQRGSSESDQFWDLYEADVPYRFFDPRYDLSTFRKGLVTQVNMEFVDRFWNTVLKEFDHTAEYSGIDTPVLVIAGKYDFGAPYFLWESVGTTIPDFTFHLFENAGHNPMLEVPNEFDQVVADWIQGRT